MPGTKDFNLKKKKEEDKQEEGKKGSFFSVFQDKEPSLCLKASDKSIASKSLKVSSVNLTSEALAQMKRFHIKGWQKHSDVKAVASFV